MAEAASRSVITDWGTPDPRDADAYPARAASLQQFAWEFLRRRQDYRRRWQQLTTDHGHKQSGIGQGGRAARWRSAAEVLREQYRVHDAPDPRVDRPPLFEGADVVVEVQVQHTPVLPPKTLIEFDVTWPIELQLDGARRLLQQRAKATTTSRPQTDKLVRYLRLLDFFEEDAADREIGKYLFRSLVGEHSRDAVRTNFNQARRWQADYLILALHTPAAS
jgi:hypothetical protein